MKTHLELTGLLLVMLSLFSCASKKREVNRNLIDRIRTDQRFEKVEKMAERLVSKGFTAGDGYGEVWIRDLNAFVELAVKVNGEKPVSEALSTFFKFQDKDGNIPDGYIPRDRAGGGYKYRSSPLEPDYVAHKNTVETDQESSLVQAIYRYVQSTGDIDFLQKKVGRRRIIDRMDDALQYLLNDRYNERYGLLWGATTIDWGDVQPEHSWGVELDSLSHPAIDIYDNAMFLLALDNYLELLNDKERAEHWKAVRNRIKKNARTHLWDVKNRKFRPHLYLEKGSPFPKDFDEDKIYYHGGTYTAIAADLLSEKEIKETYKKIRRNVEESGAPSIGLTVYPPYPNGAFKNEGLAEYSYQNGGDWTWFGGRMVQELINRGMYEEAYESISPMLDLVLEHNDFYEWWTRGGKPAGSGNFRGAAGVLWKSIQLFKQKIKNEPLSE